MSQWEVMGSSSAPGAAGDTGPWAWATSRKTRYGSQNLGETMGKFIFWHRVTKAEPVDWHTEKPGAIIGLSHKTKKAAIIDPDSGKAALVEYEFLKKLPEGLTPNEVGAELGIKPKHAG